jgi:hypothetical protein
VVVPHLRTVTVLCPAVRTFVEHFLLVVADTADILTGRWRTISGHRPRSREAAAPRPDRPGDAEEGMLVPSGIMRPSQGLHSRRETLLRYRRGPGARMASVAA